MSGTEDRPSVLAERCGDEVFVGPTFGATDDPCLQCFVRRRQFSGAPPGPMVWLDPADVGALPDRVVRLLRDHQVGSDGSGRHLFLPFPDCPCPRGREAATADAMAVVSARLGPILVVTTGTEQVDEASRGGGGSTEYVASSRPAPTPGTGGRPVLAHGSGRAGDGTGAELRAVAESVERYCAGFWNHSAATRLSGDGADATVTGHLVGRDDPGDVAHPSAPVALPAHAVFLPYPASPTTQDSVGLAAGRSASQARRLALAEAIERRSFWQAVAGRARPVPPGTPCGASPGAGAARDSEVLVWAGDLDHVVACVIRRAPVPPFVTLGLGCATTPGSAVAKARSEGHHVTARLREVCAGGEGPPVGSRMDELLWLLATDMTAGLEVLASLRRRDSVAPEPPTDYAAVDLTTRDVATAGWAVARVVPVTPTN